MKEIKERKMQTERKIGINKKKTKHVQNTKVYKIEKRIRDEKQRNKGRINKCA